MKLCCFAGSNSIFFSTNLYFDVRTPTSLQALDELIVEGKSKLERNFGGSTIIYCPTRSTVMEVSDYLRGSTHSFHSLNYP